MMKIFLATLLLLTSFTAHSADGSMQLVGEARLKVLFWSVYDSRLYTADGAYTPDKRPVKLELDYLRDFKAVHLVDRTLEEWQQQGLENPRQLEWVDALTTIWPDISKGDTLALEVDSQSISRFFHNGELIGTLKDPDFGPSFLAIWLSEKTSQPELRLTLIGEDTP